MVRAIEPALLVKSGYLHGTKLVRGRCVRALATGSLDRQVDYRKITVVMSPVRRTIAGNNIQSSIWPIAQFNPKSSRAERGRCSALSSTGSRLGGLRPSPSQPALDLLQTSPAVTRHHRHHRKSHVSRQTSRDPLRPAGANHLRRALKAERPAETGLSDEAALSAWHSFMVANHLAYDEGMEFLGKVRIELCRRRQLP
jgi:hypothetical protein